MRRQPLGEHRLAHTLDPVQADRHCIMIANRRRQKVPVAPGLLAHGGGGEAADCGLVGLQDACAERDEQAANLPRQFIAIGLASKEIVDRFRVGARDDPPPDRPEMRIFLRSLRRRCPVPAHPAIGEQGLHPFDARFAGDGIVRQRANQDRQLVDQPTARIDQRDVSGVRRQELAEDEPAPHAAAAFFRHSLSPITANTKNSA